MFLKPWVNFIHNKTPLNHSAVLIWNLHLASTRSNAHLVDSTGRRIPVHSSSLRLMIPLLRHAPHFDDVILDDLLPGSAKLIVELIYGLDRFPSVDNFHNSV